MRLPAAAISVAATRPASPAPTTMTSASPAIALPPIFVEFCRIQCGDSDVPFSFAAASSKGTSESKPHWNHIVASVLMVLTFVKVPAAIRYECQNRDTSEARNSLDGQQQGRWPTKWAAGRSAPSEGLVPVRDLSLNLALGHDFGLGRCSVPATLDLNLI